MFPISVRVFRVLSLIAFVCLSSSPAQAGPFGLYTFAQGVAGEFCNPDAEEGTDSYSVSCSGTFVHNVFGVDEVSRFSGQGSARASYGSLGVDGMVEVNMLAAAHDRGPASMSARSEFSDGLTIDAPGLTGQSGSISFDISVDGGFAATYSLPQTEGCVSASWGYALFKNPDSDNTLVYSVGDQTMSARGSACGEGDALTLLTGVTDRTAPIDFVYGEEFELFGLMGLSMQTYSDFGKYSFVSLTFLHSADLNGIAGVRDRDGNPVTTFAITSRSGTDYTIPLGSAPTVPEPASLGLVGLGLGGLFFGRKRRPTRVHVTTKQAGR